MSEENHQETASSAEFEPSLAEKTARLEEKIQQLEEEKQILLKEKDSLAEKALRHQADAENIRKRAQQEIASNRIFSTNKLLKEMLTLADSLEKSIETAAQLKEVPKVIADGLQLTFQLLLDILSKEGVVVENPINQPFDPHFHEAIGTEDKGEANTVCKVLQTGYKLKDRSLRNALVIVVK